MQYYSCTDEERIRRTRLPLTGKIKLILDTDTYNEIDDQFAIFYALASEDRIELLGITAALFHNQRSKSPQDGMEKSYQEILKILKMAGRESEGFAFRGCERPLDDTEHWRESEAVDFMIRRAMECTREDPLYIAGIGAGTNIASAILKAPEIMDRIVVVWLGGNTYEWPRPDEFNLFQDVKAGQVLFDCGVPLIQVPASGVTGFLLTSVPELRECLGGTGEIGAYLVENVMSYEKDHFAWTKPIWDIGVIGMLVDPDWAPARICHAPAITDQKRYVFDGGRHLIRYVYELDRDRIFRDMYEKVRKLR